MTDTITKYQICGPQFSSTAIIPVEVTNETAISITVFLEGKLKKRIRKNSSYHQYFNTWEGARAELVKRRFDQIAALDKDISKLVTEITELTSRKQQ